MDINRDEFMEALKRLPGYTRPLEDFLQGAEAGTTWPATWTWEEAQELIRHSYSEGFRAAWLAKDHPDLGRAR